DAPEPQVAGGGVDRLALTGRWPVTQAVTGGTQMRAALDDLARQVRAWAGRYALCWRADAGVARRAARRLACCPMTRGEVITRPLPDIADHVGKAIAVDRERPDGRGALVPVKEQ